MLFFGLIIKVKLDEKKKNKRSRIMESLQTGELRTLVREEKPSVGKIFFLLKRIPIF